MSTLGQINKIQNPFEVLDHESNVRIALSRYGTEQILDDLS